MTRSSASLDPPKTHAQASRQRRDLVSGVVADEADLIRFVIGPDGAIERAWYSVKTDGHAGRVLKELS